VCGGVITTTDLIVSNVSVERGRDEAHKPINIELSNGWELWWDIGRWGHIENIIWPNQLSNEFEKVSCLRIR
jgi:hypothetical protein